MKLLVNLKYRPKKKKKKAKSCGKLGIPTGLWYIIYNHNKYRFEN